MKLRERPINNAITTTCTYMNTGVAECYRRREGSRLPGFRFILRTSLTSGVSVLHSADLDDDLWYIDRLAKFSWSVFRQHNNLQCNVHRFSSVDRNIETKSKITVNLNQASTTTDTIRNQPSGKSWWWWTLLTVLSRHCYNECFSGVDATVIRNPPTRTTSTSRL